MDGVLQIAVKRLSKYVPSNAERVGPPEPCPDCGQKVEQACCPQCQRPSRVAPPPLQRCVPQVWPPQHKFLAAGRATQAIDLQHTRA